MSKEKELETAPWYSYNDNPTYFYLELLNSILADILDEKHDEKYGFNCAYIIYSAFLYKLNGLVIAHPGAETMVNVIEIYTTMDYIASLYNRNVKDRVKVFNRLPSTWMITHLNFDSTARKWAVRIGRVNGAGKSPIEFGCRESELSAAIETAVAFANQTEKERVKCQ